jgi:hypothetical protein
LEAVQKPGWKPGCNLLLEVDVEEYLLSLGLKLGFVNSEEEELDPSSRSWARSRVLPKDMGKEAFHVVWYPIPPKTSTDPSFAAPVFQSSGFSIIQGNIPEWLSTGPIGSNPSRIASSGTIEDGEEEAKLEASAICAGLTVYHCVGRSASSRMALQELVMEETSRLRCEPPALDCFLFRSPVQSVCLKASQLNVHSFFHRLQFEQEKPFSFRFF